MTLGEIQGQLQQPISIMQGTKDLFTGYFYEIKEKFTREEWDKLLCKKVVDRRRFFELDVVELEDN